MKINRDKFSASVLLLCAALFVGNWAWSAADLGNTSVISPTDASNGSGTCPSWLGSAAPSTLDDAGRCLQGAIAREWQNRSFAVTSSGSANAYVVAYTVAPAAYRTGQVYSFITNFANTGDATVNINTLGAKTIKKDVAGTMTVLASGDIGSGSFITVAYNGTDMIWLNRGNSSSSLGDVVGPASATDNAVARFDSTTGKIVQNSAVTIADTTGDTTITSTNATADPGPELILDRFSASPDASDVLAPIYFRGRTSTAATVNYTWLRGFIKTATNAAEDGVMQFLGYVAGAADVRLSIGAGVWVEGATGGDQGAGTINATAVYDDGVLLAPGGMTLISTLTPSSGTTAPVTDISSDYRSLYIEVQDLVTAGAATTLNLAVSGNNGTNYGTAVPITPATASTDELNGFANLGNLQTIVQNGAVINAFIGEATGPTNAVTGFIGTVGMLKHATGGTGNIDAIQFSLTGGSAAFSTGSILVWGVK
jgi:hypothetical protein